VIDSVSRIFLQKPTDQLYQLFWQLHIATNDVLQGTSGVRQQQIWIRLAITKERLFAAQHTVKQTA
jgi:hypothetical protein